MVQLEVFQDGIGAELRQRSAVDARVARLVRAEYGFVWRTLRRFGVSAHEADDAAQRVFLITASKLDSIELGRERAFIFGCSVRVAERERRRAARHSAEDVDALDAPGSEPLADELIEQRRARLLLDSILAELGEELRAVFVLYEIEELTMSEIAALLGVPPGTVASRLRRAREQFAVLVARARRGLRVEEGVP